jgi:SAM-dependent methyltransferase
MNSQAYNRSFARVYTRLWTDFADRVAPALLEYYQGTEPGQDQLPVLDLCCGVGTVALHFLAAGYDVTGLDLSEPMLTHAADNAAQYLDSGQARFIQADAASFKSPPAYGLAVSTFDSLNHLEGLDELGRCFQNVHRALLPGGGFIFDLNTAEGLRHWDQMDLMDEDDYLLIKRGGWDPRRGRAFLKISGFIRSRGELFERFEEMVVETAFKVKDVKSRLRQAGFEKIRTVGYGLTLALADPESEPRVFFTAAKAPKKSRTGGRS